MHPALIAQAAATAAAMMPGRFFLGLGTGENLNEHILGDPWPPSSVRLAMLEEAMQVIQLLWQGGSQCHQGRYYTVEDARLYTLPDELPPIMIAAAGTQAAELAGRCADGLINVAPVAEVVEKFSAAGGAGKPCYGQMTVCWAQEEKEARRIAHEWWPTSALGGELFVELKTPAHFEQAVQLAREEDVAQAIVCGPDPQRHLNEIKKFLNAGYDHLYVHQVGPDQEGFFRFYEREILPHVP
jgi:G6PDH family F420-dependent oxidoreductase